MKSIRVVVIAAAFFVLPAAAQDANKGKSSTAPGKTDVTPGHQQQAQPGGAKTFAPGQIKTEPSAKESAPGSAQRKTK